MEPVDRDAVWFPFITDPFNPENARHQDLCNNPKLLKCCILPNRNILKERYAS